jgi:nucleoside-diphosphate-sugar epimerase
VPPRRLFSKKRVLITGATSFIGAHLARRLVDQGATVSAMISPARRLNRLHAIVGAITLHDGDIADADFVHRCVKRSKPDIIFHLASFGVHPDQRDLSAIARVNLTGTVNLLQALLRHDFEAFVNTGSSIEYGPSARPMKESQTPLPATYYGASKAGATLLVDAFAKSQTAPRRIVTLRPFHVYGPGEEPTRFMTAAIRECFHGRELPLTSLKEKRDFVYVQDVVEAYLLAASRKQLQYTVYNIGTSKEHTLGDVIHYIEKFIGKKLEVNEGAYPYRPWNSQRWAANTARARHDLGWAPRYSLERGIKETVERFLEEREALRPRRAAAS